MVGIEQRHDSFSLQTNEWRSAGEAHQRSKKEEPNMTTLIMKYWREFLIGLLFGGCLIFGNKQCESVSYIEEIEAINSAHKEEVNKIKAAHEQEEVKRQQIEKTYQETITALELRHSQT